METQSRLSVSNSILPGHACLGKILSPRGCCPSKLLSPRHGCPFKILCLPQPAVPFKNQFSQCLQTSRIQFSQSRLALQIHFLWCLLTIYIPFSQCQLSAIFDFLSSAYLPSKFLSLRVDCLLKFFRPRAGNSGNVQIPRSLQSSDPANCRNPGIPKNLKNRMIPGIPGTNESRKSRKSRNLGDPRILGIPNLSVQINFFFPRTRLP